MQQFKRPSLPQLKKHRWEGGSEPFCVFINLKRIWVTPFSVELQIIKTTWVMFLTLAYLKPFLKEAVN